jgi:2-C-methyl-D-erythritol 4-phosphate cytidylyltransferase
VANPFPAIKIILVLPSTDLDTWHIITKKYNFNIPVILQQGGDSRFQSVKKGLQKIEGDGVVAIHDGVRPLVNETIIKTSFNIASKHGSAIAAVDLKESIRLVEHTTTRAVDRAKFKIIQTPQTFTVQLIRQAYEQPEDSTLTDDASVAERAGYSIHLFEGSYENIKITTPEDLIIAEALLKARANV